MAYQTGSYTDQNNALDLWRAFLLAQGWTINSFIDDGSSYAGDTFTGKRLHVQKLIEGTTHYFNFRSCSNQRVFSYSQYGNVTGICLNGSTGYSSGSSWDQQPVFTPQNYTNTTISSGGCVDKLIETGGTYFFFATTTSATAVFTTDSDQGDYRFMTIGSMDGRSIYEASGGADDDVDSGTDDNRSSYCGSPEDGNSSNANGAIKLTDGWYVSHIWEGGIYTYRLNALVDVRGSLGAVVTSMRGSNAAASLKYSPEPFKGNAPLVACAPTLTKGTASEYYPCGILEGVFFLNMTNYTNEQEITIGANTYKLFHIFNPNPSGVAFLK